MKYVSAYRILNPAQDNIFGRWHSLQEDMRITNHLDRLYKWHDWYDRNCCKTLVDNIHWLQGKGISSKQVCQDVVGHRSPIWSGEDVEKVKHHFQRQALTLIKKVLLPDATARIRHKFARWHNITFGISGLPGIYSHTTLRRLQHLSKLVPPRVHAAVFRTIFNGWCTRRRFQQRNAASNLCVFKCGNSAEDSLEHYCRCPVVSRVAESYLHFSYTKELGLDLWLLNSYWLDGDEALRGLAILIYGTYNAFNSIRHGFIPNEQQAYHCIIQHCKQGSFGHGKCMKFLDSCWKSPITHVM